MANLKAPTKGAVLGAIADETGLKRAQVAAVFTSLTGQIKKNLGGKGPGVFAVPGLVKIEKKKIPARPAKKGVPNPFKPGELIATFESTGARLGPHVNAQTGFDDTIYMFQLPTDKDGIVEKGMQALADFAGGMTLDPKEIDKEQTARVFSGEDPFDDTDMLDSRSAHAERAIDDLRKKFGNAAVIRGIAYKGPAKEGDEKEE